MLNVTLGAIAALLLVVLLFFRLVERLPRHGGLVTRSEMDAMRAELTAYRDRLETVEGFLRIFPRLGR